jgi:hypothetical protein
MNAFKLKGTLQPSHNTSTSIRNSPAPPRTSPPAQFSTSAVPKTLVNEMQTDGQVNGTVRGRKRQSIEHEDGIIRAQRMARKHEDDAHLSGPSSSGRESQTRVQELVMQAGASTPRGNHQVGGQTFATPNVDLQNVSRIMAFRMMPQANDVGTEASNQIGV